MKRHVLIFRRDLFKASEPFIADQAAAHTWSVTFAGQHLAGPAPSGVTYITGNRGTVLAARLASRPPDVVHAHFGVDIPPALALADHFRCPLVVTLHGFDVTRRRWSSVLSGRPNLVRYGLSRPRLLRSATQLLAVSNYIAQKAVEAGAYPDRIAVHHIGAPLPNFPHRHRAVPVPGGAMNIVHVGRLVEKKGTLVLLLALAEASKLGLALHLRVVGDGPLRGRLERATGALGLSECVHFLGFQPHDRTLGFIREADALCLPSLVARNGDAEGFGMVMLEAASLGTPIIATESGGILDFVEAGRTGILVPPGDPRALSRAFVTLHEVPELVHHMVTEARRRVEMDFDVVKQTVLLEERFEHLLG